MSSGEPHGGGGAATRDCPEGPHSSPPTQELCFVPMCERHVMGWICVLTLSGFSSESLILSTAAWGCQ